MAHTRRRVHKCLHDPPLKKLLSKQPLSCCPLTCPRDVQSRCPRVEQIRGHRRACDAGPPTPSSTGQPPYDHPAVSQQKQTCNENIVNALRRRFAKTTRVAETWAYQSHKEYLNAVTKALFLVSTVRARRLGLRARRSSRRNFRLVKIIPKSVSIIYPVSLKLLSSRFFEGKASTLKITLWLICTMRTVYFIYRYYKNCFFEGEGASSAAQCLSLQCSTPRVSSMRRVHLPIHPYARATRPRSAPSQTPPRGRRAEEQPRVSFHLARQNKSQVWYAMRNKHLHCADRMLNFRTSKLCASNQ